MEMKLFIIFIYVCFATVALSLSQDSPTDTPTIGRIDTAKSTVPTGAGVTFPQSSFGSISGQPIQDESNRADKGSQGIEGNGTTLPPPTTLSPTTITTTTTTANGTSNSSIPSTTPLPSTSVLPSNQTTLAPTTSVVNTTNTTTPELPTTQTTPTAAVTNITSSTLPVPIATTETTPTKDRRFDGPSFIGGIVLSLGTMAIGFVALKFYKARTERNYHTL